jgi:D-arabinitol 4-dehydrogenase
MAAPEQLVILHLGLGAFHRAHQAAYLQRLIDAGETRWSIAAGNIRPDGVDTLAALQAQAGAFTLETVTPAGVRNYSRILSIRKVVPWDEQLSGLVEQGADPATRIISFTVTEAGYCLDGAGELDERAAAVLSDVQALQAGRAGATIYGALGAILRERMNRGGAGVTLLNCDNLRHNGDRLRTALLRFLDIAGDRLLLDWVQAHTACPNAMVDRITPRPMPEVAQRAKAATGIDDPAAVMAERFSQWVIEDRFVNGRPPWEAVGVEMVDAVDPYEEAKIRLLNATHSCIAWAGTLAGLRFIHEGVRDPRIRRFAYEYATEDAIAVLQPSPVDLPAYRDQVLERFSNAALLDTNQRVAMDGFAKIPGFIAPTVRDRLARGATIAAVALLPALFLACLRRWHEGRLPYAYEDQAMDVDRAHAICASPDPAAALAGDGALWDVLAGDPRLVLALQHASLRVADFEQGGALDSAGPTR